MQECIINGLFYSVNCLLCLFIDVVFEDFHWSNEEETYTTLIGFGLILKVKASTHILKVWVTLKYAFLVQFKGHFAILLGLLKNKDLV
jgi:hypothetical protein